MKVLILLFFVGLFCHKSYGLKASVSDAIQSGLDVAGGLIESIPSDIPTREEIFQLPKNILIGLPFTALTDAINSVCSAALSQDKVHPQITPKIEEQKLQLHTACDVESFPLLKADELAKSPNFDSKKKVVVIVSGWLTDPSDKNTNTLVKAYVCRNDTNVLLLDNSEFINTLYTWSALNTEKVGENLATSLVELIRFVPVENIHLVGHSLGAHIVGAAGRYFQEISGSKLPHITGLDPAKACFNEGETLTGIHSGNAAFVDIFHTNPDIAGQPKPLGDVDYYPGGLLPLKPGCIEPLCAHVRAQLYYAESIYPNNEKNFLAKRCTSLKRLNEGRCDGEEEVMGFAVSHDLRGNFFSEVNALEPYGQNASDDFQSSKSACGSCEKA